MLNANKCQVGWSVLYLCNRKRRDNTQASATPSPPRPSPLITYRPSRPDTLRLYQSNVIHSYFQLTPYYFQLTPYYFQLTPYYFQLTPYYAPPTPF